MPIRLNLEQVMEEHSIWLTELAERVDLTLANLSILKTNKSQSHPLQHARGPWPRTQGQPGDLLEFTKEK